MDDEFDRIRPLGRPVEGAPPQMPDGHYTSDISRNGFLPGDRAFSSVLGTEGRIVHINDSGVWFAEDGDPDGAARLHCADSLQPIGATIEAGIITSQARRKSRFRSAAELEGKPVPERRWLVNDLIPQRVVTSLYGDGGTGKSLLAKQLAIAVVTGGTWLGRPVSRGPVVFLSAEDDEDEIHRRFAAIIASEGLSFADLDQLTFRSLAGEDALLARADGGRSGVILPSGLHDEIDDVLAEKRPRLLVLDPLADLFPGSENDRAQVTQFVGILIGLAVRHDCAVLLLAHPSRSGEASGSGDGGSTAWNGKVRSRLHLRRIKTDGMGPDTDARMMTSKKSNHGPNGIEISMKWKDGLFVADMAENGLGKDNKGTKAERVFLKLLRLVTSQGRRVNDKGSNTYAPSFFAAHPESEGVAKKAFKAAMEALLVSGKVTVVTEGPPSRRVSYLMEEPG